VVVLWKKRDRYGRIVGRLLLPACERTDCPYSVDAGLEQIKSGLAWHYTDYAGEQPIEERARYAALEQIARGRRAGLWQDERAVAPWAFRRAVSAGTREASASIGAY
jgi:endonuclease YncB( thermonuclease family)